MEWYYILLIVLGSLVVATALVALLYRQFFKRFFDIFLSSIGLIIAAIPMIFTAIGVRIFLGKPVIFKQERVGRNEKHFFIYKFRTMTDKRDENGELLPDSERFTKFGKILRKTSLDELPQLFNVLKGDISLIGPRPMMVIHLPSDPDIRKQRFTIRPGITGLAQINGRVDITFAKRFEYDIEYAKHISLWNDISIMFGTVMTVIKSVFRKGPESTKNEDLDILEGTVEYERLKALAAENTATEEAVEAEVTTEESNMPNLDNPPTDNADSVAE